MPEGDLYHVGSRFAKSERYKNDYPIYHPVHSDFVSAELFEKLHSIPGCPNLANFSVNFFKLAEQFENLKVTENGPAGDNTMTESQESEAEDSLDDSVVVRTNSNFLY